LNEQPLFLFVCAKLMFMIDIVSMSSKQQNQTLYLK